MSYEREKPPGLDREIDPDGRKIPRMDNTASSPECTTENESPAVIGKYLDALYVSGDGTLSGAAEGRLAALKAALRGTGKDGAVLRPRARLAVPGGPLKVRAYGRGKYQYVVENDRVYVELTTWANLPPAKVQWKAEALYEYDLAGLETATDNLLALFLDPGFSVKVSRADIAVDFQPSDGWVVPNPQTDVICRARSWHMDGDRGEVTALTLGERTQALQAQIYRKDTEILVSGKEWMTSVWATAGYDPARPVYRCELRFYRRFLRGLVRPDDPNRRGIDTISDLGEALGDLLTAALGGYEDAPGTWLRVADPETRGRNTSRRGSAGWWATLRDAFLAGELLAGRVRLAIDARKDAVKRVKLDAVLRRIGSMSAKAAAMAQRLGVNGGSDATQWGNFVAWRYEAYLDREEGCTWAEKVREKGEELSDTLLTVDPGYVSAGLSAA